MGFRSPIDTREYERRVGLVPAPVREKTLPERPVRRGFATPLFSTENRLIVRRFVWDVNGWYRALGFTYPFEGITKRVLMNHYRDCGGPDDEWVTWVFKALMNPRIRAEYDALEMGEFYQDDPRFQRWLARKAAAEASRLRGQGVDIDFDGVMERWGFDLSGPPADGDQPSDDMVTSEDSEESGRAATFTSWPWGYYLWWSRSRDLETLSRWQDLLVAEFAARGDVRRIGVGFMGRQPHAATVCRLGQKIILLLHEDVRPTHELAKQVVARCTDETDETTQREEITS